MTNFTIPTQEIYSPIKQQQCDRSPQYTLKWRQGQLLVSVPRQVKQPYLPALESKQRLVECLKHSPVRLVRVDSRLGETGLKFWADACEQAGKAMFLKVPAKPELLKKTPGMSWWLKRLIEWIIAALLLLALSPLLLGLTWLVHSQSPGPIFTQEWCLGKRGKLFRTFKFRTTLDPDTVHPQVMADPRQGNLHKQEDAPHTPSGRWMRKYRLHKLPQLINVLRGEMSLVGPHPWLLHHAVRVSPDQQQQLNALPGITGIWRMDAKSQLQDLDAIMRCDLEYLSSWSLARDLKIILLSVPRIISGCGAY